MGSSPTFGTTNQKLKAASFLESRFFVIQRRLVLTCKVGDQGEIVIEKELRDQLGIRPGWIALQRLVDNRIEIQFTPPRARQIPEG